jgi:hypothetical protein
MDGWLVFRELLLVNEKSDRTAMAGDVKRV